MSADPPPAAARCVECDSEVPPSFLVCPVCRRLVHARRLGELAQQAGAAEGRGELRAALDAWRTALTLLPPASRQGVAVGERITALTERLPASARADTASQAGPASAQAEADTAAPGATAGRFKRFGAVGIALAFLWKLEVPLLFVLGKGKLLLGGLMQSGTLLSMLASLGVYWTAWGWRFAGGLVGAMYVHEMGHVAALRRLGIAASPPMFVPGLGAFVRMHQYPATPVEDARVGLAGPLWGLGASAAALGLYALTGIAFWAGLAHASAWLNLFNLLPLGPLDGGRGFRALARTQRAVVCVCLVAAWVATRDGLPLLLALVAGLRVAGAGAPRRPDARTLLEFVVLVGGLSAVSMLSATAVPR